MGADAELRVEVKGLLPTPTGCGVFLGHNGKTIAIFVDHHVAAAINMFMHRVEKPRPLTHDLVGNIFQGLGVRLLKVVVNDLRDNTFYARLYLCQHNDVGQSMAEVDARPSDAMALAIHHGCPIFVRQSVWDRTEDMSWALEQVDDDEGGGKNDDLSSA